VLRQPWLRASERCCWCSRRFLLFSPEANLHISNLSIARDRSPCDLAIVTPPVINDSPTNGHHDDQSETVVHGGHMLDSFRSFVPDWRCRWLDHRWWSTWSADVKAVCSFFLSYSFLFFTTAPGKLISALRPHVPTVKRASLRREIPSRIRTLSTDPNIIVFYFY